MILIFGGTTEGRRATEVLEEAGKPYCYSTKTGEQDISLHHGLRIDGAMDGEEMCAFCRKHQICLIVDAAHPFASKLHQTIARVGTLLQMPIIHSCVTCHYGRTEHQQIKVVGGKRYQSNL